mgnify:CR=1 FL=1
MAVLERSEGMSMVVGMPKRPKLLTAEELDAMSPNERAAAFDERIVRDLDELPPAFRTRVMKAGQELADDLRATSHE